ncbi:MULTISPECIES: methionine ABC transporter permease [unclassified Schaalia]|uniref:methionine ABC transporter permease n=1 Tax=unclassified Schaalia TaxID=2691889 RepID=UPI001E4B6154|nr:MULTISPECIES: methionine ABC transporter permease [unclassified Schaalia]MCD4548931.1 ABC transporter permease [Schaalia sp. lx-260]MCD4557547.1 ABC transporter permease [Schaalia sp. lx-100]
MWLDNPALTKSFLPAVGETLLMTGFSTLFTVILGVPLGLILVQTSKEGLTPHKFIHQTLGFVVNILRSYPFVILIIALIPFTRFVVGSSLGWKATVVPLVIGATPFFARLVETNIRAVAPGKIEAAQMMGANLFQIQWGVQVREALPELVQSVTVLGITLVGYSALAGVVGGGGLGQMAINYGYNRFQSDVMIVTVLAILLLVQVIQITGDFVARMVNHR